jgi:hypothetical protein
MPTRLVVADTGPLNYLVLVEAIDVLPRLFEQILVPEAVYDELAHADAPAAVKRFIAEKPAWLDVRANPDTSDDEAIDPALDEGERAAIALATSIGADLILMDDRAGVALPVGSAWWWPVRWACLISRPDVDSSISQQPLRSSRRRIFGTLRRLWTRCWRGIARNDLKLA